jgi:hypothetical protein
VIEESEIKERLARQRARERERRAPSQETSVPQLQAFRVCMRQFATGHNRSPLGVIKEKGQEELQCGGGGGGGGGHALGSNVKLTKTTANSEGRLRKLRFESEAEGENLKNLAANSDGKDSGVAADVAADVAAADYLIRKSRDDEVLKSQVHVCCLYVHICTGADRDSFCCGDSGIL